MPDFSIPTNRDKVHSRMQIEPVRLVAQQRIIFKKLNYAKHKLFQFVFAVLFLFLGSASISGQVTDTTSRSKTPQQKKSSEVHEITGADKLAPKPTKHSPKMAALMSTLIPGLGQTYNKKYWKVPVIYAGLAALAYSINFNQTKYITYLNAYKYRLEGGPISGDNYPEFRDETLNEFQQYYHRYRNLSVIGASLLYIMNIVDASVDAHMFTFDVGDDLSFNFHPTLINIAHVNGYTTGLSLNIKF
jgi:hypothetical protein